MNGYKNERTYRVASALLNDERLHSIASASSSYLNFRERLVVLDAEQVFFKVINCGSAYLHEHQPLDVDALDKLIREQ